MSESFQILRGSSIRLSSRRVCSSGLTSSQYLIKMMPESTIAFSVAGTISRNRSDCSGVQKPMTGSTPARLYQLRSKITTSPAAGKWRHVALDVHLRLLALGRGGEGHVAEHPRVRPFGDPPDRAALAGGVPPLEHDHDLGPGGRDPLLHGHQLTLEAPHLGLVLLLLHLGPGGAGGIELLDARRRHEAAVRSPRSTPSTFLDFFDFLDFLLIGPAFRGEVAAVSWCGRIPTPASGCAAPGRGMNRSSIRAPRSPKVGPGGVEGERGGGGGRELRRHLRAQARIARAREPDGQVLEARVVADEQGTIDAVVDGAQPGQEGVGAGQVELVIHLDLRTLRHGGANPVEGVEGATRWRAEHDLRPTPGASHVVAQRGSALRPRGASGRS